MTRDFAKLKFADSTEAAKYTERVMRDPAAFGVDRCFLCGEPSAGIGVLIPTKTFAARLGLDAGVHLYGLCQSCKDKDSVYGLVETEMLNVMGRGVENGYA